MSEDNQENGASNGDVPEIELIIKDETNTIEDSESELILMSTVHIDQLVLPIPQTCPTNDEYIIIELKSDDDGPPSCNYVIANPKEPPPDPEDQPNTKENTNTENIVSTVTEILSNPGPYIVSVEIPVVEGSETFENETETPPIVVRKDASPKTKRALARKRLPDAVDAVVNDGLTIGKAAKAFGVTKSTLWKAVNKKTDQRKKKVDEDLNKKIVDRICAGESLSEISRSLKVAKSTIHLHKVRLSQSGKLPRHVTLKPPVDKVKQLALKDRIIQAYRGVRVNGMSLRLASSFFSVPRSTLWCYIRKFRASQKKQEEITREGHIQKEAIEEEDEESDEEDDEEDEEEDENECMSDQRSVLSERALQEDFDLLDAYCEQEGNSENRDLLISVDFETFEEYVKREFEES